MNISDILNNTITQFILAVICIIQFLVSIISYLKISRVRKSQTEYHDIIELDKILGNLESNTDILKKLSNKQDINLPDDMKHKIQNMVDLNYECIGAVNKANQILLNYKNNNEIQNGGKAIYHERGYFNKEFFDSKILTASKRIFLYLKRNTRPFTLDNLKALVILAENGVRIDIFAFSTNIEKILLEQMMASIPNCPTIDVLLNTQISNRQSYIDTKEKMKNNKQNINYYEYKTYPLSQYIIVDNTLYWGIVNYDKSQMDDVFEDRPYVEMDASSDFAKYILSLHRKIIDDCTKNGEKY